MKWIPDILTVICAGTGLWIYKTQRDVAIVLLALALLILVRRNWLIRKIQGADEPAKKEPLQHSTVDDTHGPITGSNSSGDSSDDGD